MNIQELTYILLASRLIDEFDSQKLVDWGVCLLENGFESESLLILAGLDSDSTQVREQYFWQTVEELKIDIDKSDFELIENYSLFISKQVQSNEISPEKGLEIMNRIVIASDYDSKYLQFYEIDEDISYLNHSDSTIYNNGLTKQNKSKFIKREFQLFVEMMKLNLEEDIRNHSYCEKCKTITTPILKPKFRFRKPRKVQVWTCSTCGSSKLAHYSSQDARILIINKLKTAER